MNKLRSIWLRWQQPRWADELDFVGPRVRTAAWSWVLLLAGLTAAAWVWPAVMQMDADATQAQLDLKRLQRATHQQTIATQVPRAIASASAPSPVLTAESARHAAQMAQWMGYPWMEVIAKAETAAGAEQAVMLSFSLDIATLGTKPNSFPDVRVAAAVRDDASALRWAQALGASGQLLSRERLSSPFTAIAGQYDWRAQASWPGGAP